MEVTQNENKNSAGVLIQISSEGFCVRTNDAIFEETGYLPQEIIGKKFKSFLEIDASKLRDLERKISENPENIVYFDSYFKLKSGSSQYMQWTMYWSENLNQVICIGKVLGKNEELLAREIEHLKLLNAINENIQLYQHKNDLLQEVCKIFIKTGHYPIAWVFGIENNRVKLVCKDSETFISEAIFENSFIGSSLIQSTKNNNNASIAISIDPAEEKNILQDLAIPIKKIMLILLPTHPTLYLGVASTDSTKFDDKTKSIFQKIGSQLGFALKSFQNESLLSASENKLKKHIRELHVLNEINNIILHVKEEAILIDEVLKTLNEHGNYQLSWIAFFEADKEKSEPITPILSRGADEYAKHLKFDLNNPEILKGPAATSILTRKSSIVNSSQHDPNFSYWRAKAKEFGLNSIICLYLPINNKDRGVLGIYSSEVDAFDSKEMSVLERISQNLAYAINSIRTLKESSQFKNLLSNSQKKLLDYEKALNETAIIAITDERGLINYVNKNFEETYGLKGSDTQGKSLSMVSSKFHPAEFWIALWSDINSGKTWIGNIKNLDHNGQEKWFRTIIYPFLDLDNKPYQFLSMQRDITESIVLQEKVALANRLIDSAETPIYSINLDYTIISWNQAASSLFGYQESELLGKAYTEILNEDEKDELDIFLSKIKKGNAIAGIEVTRKTKSNSKIYLSLHISPLRNDKLEIIGAAIIAKDITRTKQAELMAFSLNTKLITREREFEFLYELSNLNKNSITSIGTYLQSITSLFEKHWNNHLLSNVKITYQNKTFSGSQFKEYEHYTASEKQLEEANSIEILVYHPQEYRLSKSEKYLLNLSYSWISSGIKYKEYSYKLSERIKELNTLHFLLKLSEQEKNNLDSFFQKLVNYLPQGWQFPDLICAHLTYNNISYWSDPTGINGKKQTQEFETIDQIKGCISVGYKTELENKYEELFLVEEQNLLIEIAENLRATINQQILQSDLKKAENKIQQIANYVDAAVLLMQANGTILFKNLQSVPMFKEVFEINLSQALNVLDQLRTEKHHELIKAIDGLNIGSESQYLFESLDHLNKVKSFELKLLNLDPSDFTASDKLLVLREITHLKDREEEINNLVNLLKDLNFITSFEISHELHKLQSIVELAQDLDFVDTELRDIFSTSKDTFTKTNNAVKKLIDRINIPLQKELRIANNLKRIEKVILIDEDELSNKISLRMLEKHFDPMKLICFINVDEAMAYLKSEPDSGNNVILLDPGIKQHKGWDFLDFYQNKNMKSPVILIGSKPDQLGIQRAMTYVCIKNYILKPLNNETAKQINSKETFIWNN